MSSFEKLFVNSTNRLSAVRNIILFENKQNFSTSNHLSIASNQSQVSPFVAQSNQKESLIDETYEELVTKYRELNKNIQQATQEKNIMMKLFQKMLKVEQGQDEQLRKRFRRKKNQIQLKYSCKLSNCDKSYSSSTSLARHMKLKHSSESFEPPQPNYQIPPQPNLNESSQLQKREETRSCAKNLEEKSCKSINDALGQDSQYEQSKQVKKQDLQSEEEKSNAIIREPS